MKNTKKETAPGTVEVHVPAADAVRFRVGSRWVVEATSLGSLWEDSYTVRLQEVRDADEPTEGPA